MFLHETNVKKLFILLFILCTTQSFCLNYQSEDRIGCQKALSELIQNFLNEMDIKYGLYSICDNPTTRGQTEEMSLSLATDRRASLEEAREIEVNAIERLLELLNDNDKIKPFFAKIPYSNEDLSVSISFNQRNIRGSKDGTISHLHNAKNNIYYYTQDVFDTRFSDFFEESYEEALQIVKNDPLPYDMRYHKEQGFEKEIDKLCTDFARKAYKKYGIKCEKFGGKMVNGIEEVAFDFVSFKKTSLEQARKMEIELTEMLLNDINSNPKLRPYLKQYPFTAKMTPTRIHFLEKKGGWFIHEGSVSRMFQKDGRIHYFKEKPPTEWVDTWTDGDPILDETFEEAALKLKSR